MKLNKLKSILVLLIVTFLVACNTDELENKIADLEQQNHELQGGSTAKDGQIEEYMLSMNEIYDNLAVIKEKENLINANIDMSNGEITENIKDKIVEDINLINSLLEDNQKKMANLNSRLQDSNSKRRNSNAKIVELEKLIQNLAQQMEDKDAEIGSLQNQLANANAQLKVLFEEYNNRIEELGEQTDKLNTAYYCYGTKKELKEQGVITKEGGFIGIGKTAKLSEDFNKDYFTQIDITIVQQVDLMAKKVKIVTNHPTDSYKLEMNGDNVEKLVILDAATFWASSKYLVVIVE